MYRYRSAAALDATKRYAALAKEQKIPLTELALRWAKQRGGMTTAWLWRWEGLDGRDGWGLVVRWPQGEP